MKKLLMTLVLSLALAAPSLAADAPKVGYVNLQRVLLESNDGKVAKQTISEKIKTVEAQVKERQQALKTLKADLEKQAPLLAEDARREKERGYNQQVGELESFTQSARKDLQQQDADFTRRILKDTVEVVQQLGKEGKYTLILERNEGALLYADDGIDLTDKVIELYNAKTKKK